MVGVLITHEVIEVFYEFFERFDTLVVLGVHLLFTGVHPRLSVLGDYTGCSNM